MGSIYGYEVVSGLPLRRLHALSGPRGHIRVERGADSLLDRHGELTAWHDEPGLDGHGFALARTADALLAWCSVNGAFEIDSSAGRIRVAPSSTGDAWEHRLDTVAVPLLLAERGDLVLHGSAVVSDGRAVLFCGPSGRGKSTLALLASRLGQRVLSEDGAVVEMRATEAIAWPGASGVQVADDAAATTFSPAATPERDDEVGGRRRRRLRQLAPEAEPIGPASVAAVCVLAPRGAALALGRLTPSEAIPALVPNLIHAGGPEALRPAFQLLVRLVERTPVYRVTMPDRISRASEATRSLLTDVAA